MSEIHDGVWFIYDGDCPLCQQAALALRIRRELGQLHLLNARTEQHHPLLQAIRARKLDLDEGMVIIHNGHFYHGKSALRFMARFGERQGWFNLFNRLLFWSDHLAALLYPWMRGTRNWLLRRRKRPPLDNLQRRDQPIFQSIFGGQWDDLPPVMKKHYANHPYSHDRVVVEGRMAVEFRSVLHVLRPFYRLLGTVPIVSAQNVPVRVEFDSDPDTRAFHFNRTFLLPSARPYHFRTRMLQRSGNELVEIMRFGICWCLRYEWDGQKVRLQHRGYALHWFGHFIPVPLHWLLGRGDAEEVALDDDRFAMQVTLMHPLLGQLYSYRGEFRVVSPV
jgi:predicted DCC family thiol-disulfide oxidoreductase YuxK